MTTIDFDCLVDDTFEEKWDSFCNIYTVDILRKIRTPVDAHLSIMQNEISVLETDLVANIPLTLNLPVFAILYADLKIKLTPEVPLEMTGIRELSRDARRILRSIGVLKIPPREWKVDCKNGVLQSASK